MTRKNSSENCADVAEGIRLVFVGAFGLACNAFGAVVGLVRDARAARRERMRKEPVDAKAEVVTENEEGGEDKGV
jgi:hypothetical protein